MQSLTCNARVPFDETLGAMIAVKQLTGHMWVNDDQLAGARTLGQALRCFRWETSVDELTSDVVFDYFAGENAGDEAALFMMLAPYMADGSEISVSYDGGEEIRTWTFSDGEATAISVSGDATGNESESVSTAQAQAQADSGTGSADLRTLMAMLTDSEIPRQVRGYLAQKARAAAESVAAEADERLRRALSRADGQAAEHAREEAAAARDTVTQLETSGLQLTAGDTVDGTAADDSAQLRGALRALAAAVRSEDETAISDALAVADALL
jgi:hypothetical protein